MDGGTGGRKGQANIEQGKHWMVAAFCCFDVLMMLKDQVLLSFTQDKNPRKSTLSSKFNVSIFT